MTKSKVVKKTNVKKKTRTKIKKKVYTQVSLFNQFPNIPIVIQ